MRQLNAREKAVAVIAAVALGVLGVDRLVISPLWRWWGALNSAIAQEQQEVRYRRSLLAKAPEIKRAYAAWHRAHPEPRSAAGTDPMTHLLRDIESMARQNALPIRDLRPDLSGDGRGRITAVSMTASASWETLARFLYALQQNAESYVVQKASLRQESESGVVLGQLTIRRLAD